MNKSFCLALLAALILQVPALADGPLQGRVEQRNALVRVSRPALPNRPSGDAMDYVPAGQIKHKAKFDLSSSSVSNLLDIRSFDFNYLSGKLDPQERIRQGAALDKAGGSLTDGTEEGDKELTIAWEAWHKRLCSTVYHYWLTYGNIPGEGTVILRITKEGNIDFELQDYHVRLAEEFSPEQRDLFEHSVAQTLQMVDHTDVLTFPERSRRKGVLLRSQFSFSEEDGPQGYSWKKDDYERVVEPPH